MRGLLFNYLFAWVDDQYGYALVDQIIEASPDEYNGVFVNGEIYEDQKFVDMIRTASEILDIPSSEIQMQCGRYAFKHLYKKLTTIYNIGNDTTDKCANAFEFISKLDTIHYQEVAKLYPRSEFPHFKVMETREGYVKVGYRSARNLPHLAEGFFLGCIEYFAEPLTLYMEKDIEKEGTQFIIQREGKEYES